MAGYVIANITVKDPTAYEEYKKLAGPTVAAFGGAYIVRGGDAARLEGDLEPRRLVVLKFDSVEAARRWYESPEYAPAAEVRRRAADTQMILVEGT